jgi:hypothetical protein
VIHIGISPLKDSNASYYTIFLSLILNQFFLHDRIKFSHCFIWHVLKKVKINYTCSYENPYRFWQFYGKLLVLSRKVTSTVMKGFPKTSSSRMNRCLKASEVDNFRGFFNTVCRIFRKLIHVAISGFWKPFHGSTAVVVLVTF